jgi:hypothetical protein
MSEDVSQMATSCGLSILMPISVRQLLLTAQYCLDSHDAQPPVRLHSRVSGEQFVDVVSTGLEPGSRR